MECSNSNLNRKYYVAAFVAVEDKELFVMITGAIMLLQLCVKRWGSQGALL